jgi:uncharacterized protein
MTPGEVSGTSGSEEAFIRFIATELMQEIDQRYRTLPFRLLAGHSLAGLFAIDCFLTQRAFQAYIAIDPSLRWGNEAMVRKAEALAKNHKTAGILYTAQANNPFDKISADKKDGTFKKFKAVLEANTSGNMIYKNEYFESEDHYSIPSIAFYRAFLFVFNGFKIPLYESTLKSTADIVQYYTRFQKRMHADIAPPGKLIDQVAHYHLSEKLLDPAIELLKFNEIYYPNAFVTHQSLGDAFRAKGNVPMAIKYYQEALRLKPENEPVRTALRELARP